MIPLPIRPQGSQIPFFTSKARFVVAVIGRQWGKSTLASLRHARKATSRKEKVLWWVAPVIAQARIMFKRMCAMYKPWIREQNNSLLEIVWCSGSQTIFKGSDNYDALRGETLDDCTLDECGVMRENIWPEIIRPMLAVKEGTCDFTGTPKGSNWFKDLYLGATGGEWARFHAASSDSPFFPQKEFDAIKAKTPDLIFRQEYLAEFIEDGSEVFRSITQCIKGELQEPHPHKQYVAGVDLAKHYDFTVITIWDLDTNHLVAFDRFNQIDWPFQEQRILNLTRKYNNCRIILDATGVGDPVFDKLREKNVFVEPVRITSQIKNNMIKNLSMLIENQEISYPHIPELISELQMFSIQKTKIGNLQYSAPEGYHDDIVISMALAGEAMKRDAVLSFEPI